MYRFAEHTAEVELHIQSPTEEGVFAEALAALGTLVALDAAGEPARRTIEVCAPDRGALLVGWLEELIFLADTEGFIPERATGLGLTADALRATVLGRTGEVDPLVKAATYHGLEFRRAGTCWQAQVVLDV